MNKMIHTRRGNVIVEGVNFIASDSIVTTIERAFEKFDTPEDISRYIHIHYGQVPRNVFLVPEKKVVFTSF